MERRLVSAQCVAVVPHRPPPYLTPQTGEWKHTKGEYGVDEGIQTGPDARFFSLSAPLNSEVKNEGKDLIISYTVKHEQNLDCGGAYIKLVNPGACG